MPEFRPYFHIDYADEPAKLPKQLRRDCDEIGSVAWDILVTYDGKEVRIVELPYHSA